MPSGRFEQVYQAMRKDILSAPADTRMPSIRGMMRKYESSQLLIDRALNRLLDERLLRKRSDGIYTFLSHEADDLEIGFITTSWNSMVRMEQLRALKNCAAERNMRISEFIYHYFSPFRTVKLTDHIKALIISAGHELTPDDFVFLRGLNIPVLFINHEYREIQLNFVSSDYYESGLIAAEYLIRAGHRSLALLFSQPHTTLMETRAHGFLRTAALFHVPVTILDVGVKSGEAASEKVYPYMMEYLKKNRPPFTAMLTLCDGTAGTAICALSKSGYRVPEDISVIGAEGLGESAFFLPPLTTVGVNLKTYMNCILDSIFTLLEHPEATIARTIRPKLIERESVRNLRKEKESI